MLLYGQPIVFDQVKEKRNEDSSRFGAVADLRLDFRGRQAERRVAAERLEHWVVPKPAGPKFFEKDASRANLFDLEHHFASGVRKNHMASVMRRSFFEGDAFELFEQQFVVSLVVAAVDVREPCRMDAGRAVEAVDADPGIFRKDPFAQVLGLFARFDPRVFSERRAVFLDVDRVGKFR